MGALALNIKDPETERLAAEVAKLAGETKTGAIRQALRERKQRLLRIRGGKTRSERLIEFLEREVWPYLPEGERGRPLSREEEDEILGYGPEGV
jgi:antitoxin VapB